MFTAPFEYFAPQSVEEAAQLLAEHGDNAKILAGGHSLIPIMKLRLAKPSVLIDLSRIPSLSFVEDTNGGLRIGPTTTYYELMTSDLVKARAPVIAEAASVVADVQVRNRGTIGGSLAHADPAGDMPAVALALGARLSVTSRGASRTIDIEDFFVDLLTTSLEPSEIIDAIEVPALPQRTGAAYAKFANKASHYAVVGVAAVMTVDGSGACVDARVGVTGAGPKAVRARETEDRLKGATPDDAGIERAAAVAGAGIDFLDDIHASGEYRAHLTAVFARRAIQQAVSRAG